jgi:nicotinamidase-related amidase
MTIGLNPNDCALLLIDLQIGAISSVKTMEPARLKDNAIALASACRLHGMPSVLIAGKRPGIAGAFLPELKLLCVGHILVERTQVAAFENSNVAEAVSALGRRTIIAAGVATDIGLLYAALGARAAGYAVWAVIDASGTTDPVAEECAKARMASAGVILTGWASVAAALMGDFSGPHAHDTMALLAQRTGVKPFE